MARKSPPVKAQVVAPLLHSNAFLKGRLIDFDTGSAALEAQHMRSHGVFMPELSQEDDYTLRMADTLDGVLFCLRERELGNRTIVQVFINFYSYAMELNPTGRALTILQYAKARWDSMGL